MVNLSGIENLIQYFINLVLKKKKKFCRKLNITICSVCKVYILFNLRFQNHTHKNTQKDSSSSYRKKSKSFFGAYEYGLSWHRIPVQPMRLKPRWPRLMRVSIQIRQLKSSPTMWSRLRGKLLFLGPSN